MADPPRKRISRPHDIRVVKSREALRGALLRLIETRPMQEIAISDVTKEARVSYPVFFRQFSSTAELLADLATDQVQKLLSHTYPRFDAAMPTKSLIDLCDYIAAHRTLWKSLLTTGAAVAMRVEFARISASYAETAPRVNPWLPVELGAVFVAGGIFDILAWWLKQPDDYPVGNVVKLLDALVVQSTARPQEVILEDYPAA